jgi:hypothetical protein
MTEPADGDTEIPPLNVSTRIGVPMGTSSVSETVSRA